MKKILLTKTLTIIGLAALTVILWWFSPAFFVAESERTETVFVYATLKNPLLRSIICRCFVESKPVTLTGYQKTGRNIEPVASAKVSGELIMVSPAELKRLDEYEGVPNYYQRNLLHVPDLTAWVYIKIPKNP